MGVGFTLALILIALIREVFGSGTITLFSMGNFDGVIKIPLLNTYPVRILTLAAGALLLMGYLKGFFEWFTKRKRGVIAMVYVGLFYYLHFY